MAKPGLSQVTTSQTFQSWLDKTNELVTLVGTDVITASVLGDTTSGNATLVGSFTANTVIAFNTMRADTISPKVGSTSISVTSPVSVSSATQTAQTLVSSSGPRLQYSSGAVIWSAGFENVINNNFIVNTGPGANKLTLTPTGNLSVAGTISNSVAGGTIVASLTGDVTGNVTGTVSSLSNHTTNNLTEGSNLYFTTTRARNSISVAGALSYNSSTGVISITDSGIRALFSSGTGISYNASTGNIAVSSAVVLNTRLVSTGNGLIGGGDLSANRTLSADFATQEQAQDGSGSAKVMSPPRTLDAIRANAIRGYIVFNGTTGVVIKSKNLTLSKVGSGNYSIICDSAIRDGSSNWGVVITNIDDGILSQTPIGINSGTVNSFQNNWWNAFATSFTSAGFTVRSKRTYSQWFSFLVGNDNGGGNAFGVEAIDPSYIALVVF